MIPLGFFSVCLRSPRLAETVNYYKALGFTPVGEDAPGLRVSLQFRSQSLTFMSFLQDNLINFRGAHIHRLKMSMVQLGIPITEFPEFKSEERLMLDDDGNPLPDNECGSFSICDPDGHELFFNTHREEREPFEKALARDPVDVRAAGIEPEQLDLTYCLVVSDLTASQLFYESLGLEVESNHELAWVYPKSHVGDTRFIFQLKLGEERRVEIRLSGTEFQTRTLGELGINAVEPPGLSVGHDPDGRILEINQLPNRAN